MVSEDRKVDLVLRITEAVSSGVSPICATCDHYWEARDRQRGSACGPHGSCGGPISGRLFPKYKGLMAREILARVCFMTGDGSDYGVRIVGESGMVGISKERLPELAHQCARHTPPGVRVLIVDGLGRARLISAFASTPGKPETLGQLIAAVDRGEQL